MERKILQRFLGEIRGVPIQNERIYYCMEYLLEQIEYQFGECYTDEFVRDLLASIERAYFKYDDFNFTDFENNLFFQTRRLEELHFHYQGSVWKFEELNQKLETGYYTKDKVLS